MATAHTTAFCPKCQTVTERRSRNRCVECPRRLRAGRQLAPRPCRSCRQLFVPPASDPRHVCQPCKNKRTHERRGEPGSGPAIRARQREEWTHRAESSKTKPWRTRKRPPCKRETQKQTAQRLFAQAVKAGRLIRPDTCEVCGKTGTIEGHHKDYQEPYVVMWLCRGCHAEAHRMDDHAKNPRLRAARHE